MRYLTRELYNSIQIPSYVSEEEADILFEKAEKAWDEALTSYESAFEAIRNTLPEDAVRIEKEVFHDNPIRDINIDELKGTISFNLYWHVPKAGEELLAKITFYGVSEHTGLESAEGDEWKYSELHLGSEENFELHILGIYSEIEIHATDVKLEKY